MASSADTTTEAANEGSGEQENKLAKARCNAKNASSVQVQYLATRRHFREVAPAKLNIGLEIERQQTAKNKPAELNNNQGEFTNQEQVGSPKQAANLMTQTGVSGTTNNITTERSSNNNKLHSRSVSLIVSPEFSSESSTESNGGSSEATNTAHLYRRRSVSRAPRRARLLLVGSQPALNRHRPDAERQLDGKVEMVSSSKELDPTRMHLVSSNCNHSINSAPTKDCSTDLETSSSPSEEQTVVSDNLEQFRQAGIFLREISDKFFR